MLKCDEQPAGASRKDSRDPFLFVQDDMVDMLVGGRGFHGHGRLLLYRNARPEDASSPWEFVQVLAENDGSLGSMWECPGLFTLDATGNREFSFARKPGADTCLRAGELDTALLDDCKVFHFGTLSLTVEPARSATRAATLPTPMAAARPLPPAASMSSTPPAPGTSSAAAP